MTKLAGDRTYFLPFNRGSHPERCNVARNPHPSGYRSGYFWLGSATDSFLDILGGFMFTSQQQQRVA